MITGEETMTDWCSECGAPIHYVSIDHEPYAWRHVLERMEHDAEPSSVTLKAVTFLYEEAR